MRSFFFFLLIPLTSVAQDHGSIRLANEYFQRNEIEKARTIYEELKKDRDHIPLIFPNYVSILEAKGDYEEAERFLLTAIRQYPFNFQFRAGLIRLYHLSLKTEKQDRNVRELMAKYKGSAAQLAMLARNLANEGVYDPSLRFFREARKAAQNETAYALEMASVHYHQGNKPEMINEYLNYASQSRAQLNYVKNLLQNILQEEEDLTTLERILIHKVQKNPDTSVYGELLIWIELQRKNFYGAFIQARAIDKRNGSEGDRSMHIGRIALENKAWDDAVTIFDHVANQYEGSDNYPDARKYYISAKEQKVKSAFPIDEKHYDRWQMNIIHFMKN